MELNNIYCGDCYELIKQIPDKSIDLIYTDIPYLFANHGAGKSELATRLTNREKYLMGVNDKYENAKGTSNSENLRIWKGIVKSSLNVISIEDGIDYSIFDEYMRVMKKMNLFIWCSKMQILDILNYFSKFGTFDILVWCKTNPIPATNNNWLPDIEYCLYFREKGVRLNDGYELKHKWFTSPINKKDKDLYGHPTIKPLDLVKKHILHTTDVGGLY